MSEVDSACAGKVMGRGSAAGPCRLCPIVGRQQVVAHAHVVCPLAHDIPHHQPSSSTFKHALCFMLTISDLNQISLTDHRSERKVVDYDN
jgi:hypothetical protein